MRHTHTPSHAPPLSKPKLPSAMRVTLALATLLALAAVGGLASDHDEWPTLRLRTRTISTR